ncbi:MAG: hypothetical protein AAB495_00130 [Patescibacteria group bacterium]
MENPFEKYLPPAVTFYESLLREGVPFDEVEELMERVDLGKLEKEIVTDAFGLSKEKVNILDDERARERTLASIARLIIELRKNISEYDTVIGDDASARILALLIGKIIDKKRKESGKNPAQKLFVQGGRHGKEKIWEAVRDFLSEKAKKMGKTLLVTEYITSGRGIMPTVLALEASGVDFDLASVSITNNPESYPPEIQRHLVFGSVGQSGLGLYSRSSESGVRKNYNRKAGSKDPTLEAPRNPHVEKMKNAKQDRINFARRDVSLVAEELGKLVD